MAGPIPGITELDADAVEELYRRLLDGARRISERRPTAPSPTSLRPVGGLPPASVTPAGFGLGTSIPSAISAPVIGAAAGYAISSTEEAADELNKSLDEYSPTEITNTPEAIAAYLGLPYARGVRYKGLAPVTKRNPTTAPTTGSPTAPTTRPPAAFVGPTQDESQPTGIGRALDYTREGLRASLADDVTGQPSAPTEDAVGGGGNSITAVKDPVTGKVTFVTRNRLGGEGGYDPGTEIGYEAGIGSLGSREKLLGEGQAVLAKMKEGATPLGPKPPTDVTQLENWNDYLDVARNERLARELGVARQGQALEAADIDPRRRENAELLTEAARAGLLGAQSEETLAQGKLLGARAQQLSDPVGQAKLEGRARAAGAAATEGGRFEEAQAYLASPRGQSMVEQKIAQYLAQNPRFPRTPVALQKLREDLTALLLNNYATGTLPAVEQEQQTVRYSGGMLPQYGLYGQ